MHQFSFLIAAVAVASCAAIAQAQTTATPLGGDSLSLPTNPSIMHTSKLELLKIAEDASFERQYINEFGIQAHRQTIDQFHQALQNAEDVQVKAFARQALPALEQRLQRAQSLLGQL